MHIVQHQWSTVSFWSHLAILCHHYLYQGFFVFVFIIFTEGFSYWMTAFLSCKKHKSKSSQLSVPTTNKIINTMKSGTTPSSLPRQEKNNAHLNAKNTESTNGELELQSSSNAASSIELMSINSMGA